MSLTPTSRREQYYDAIANGSTDVPDPISREEQYLKAIAENGGGGETSQPDFVYGGSCASAPTGTELTNALADIEFKSDIDTMVEKVQETGDLNVSGVFVTEDQTYYKSVIDHNYNVQVLPKDAAIRLGYPVDSDVILLYLSAVQSSAYAYCGICVMNGELVAYPLGGG